MTYLDTIVEDIKNIEDYLSRYSKRVFICRNLLNIYTIHTCGRVKYKLKKFNQEYQIFIFKSINDVYRNINYSILSGEYVLNDAERIIDTIVNKYGALTSLMNETEEEDCKILFSLVTYVKHILLKYKTLVHLFHNSINNPTSQYLNLEFENQENIEGQNFIDRKLIDLNEITNINLMLMTVDNEFNYSVDYLGMLNSINYQLNNETKINEEYVNLIKRKSEILIYKFKFVKDNVKLRTLINCFKGNDQSVKFDPPNDILLCKKISQIKEEYQYYIDKEFRQLKEVKDYESPFFYFFVKCHYYKNISKNPILLADLEKEFEEYRKNITNDFDKQNAKWCQNYLANCRLSFLLKQPETTLEQVLTLTLQIRNIQDYTSVKNYFPYLRIAKWYSEYIQVNNDCIEIEDRIRILNCLEKNLDLAKEYLLQNKNNAGAFIPFKPSFLECIEKLPLKGDSFFPVFIRSSYILPVDYADELEELNSLQEKLSTHKIVLEAKKESNNLIKANQELKKEIDRKINETDSLLQKVESNFDELKGDTSKEIKEAQKNSVQILAIFAGIVIFASGSIQLFKEANNVKDAAILMLLFAASLGILSIAVWLFTSYKNKWETYKTIIVLFIIIGIAVLNCYAIFGDWGKTSIGNNSSRGKEATK